MIIHVEKPPIPSWVAAIAAQEGLELKQEFHLTIAQALDPKPSVDLTNWQVEFLPEYYLAQRHYEVSKFIATAHTRRSLVQRVSCPELVEFRRQLGLGDPFAHVTLFVNPSSLGIAIWGANDPLVKLQRLLPDSCFRSF